MLQSIKLRFFFSFRLTQNMPIQRRYIQLPETSSVFGFGMLEMKPPKIEKYHRSLNYIHSAGLLNANFLTVVWTDTSSGPCPPSPVTCP